MIKHINISTVGGLALALGVTGGAWAEPLVSSTLSLEGAIGKAIAESPRLKASQAAMEVAMGAEYQATAWTNPELSIEAANLAGSGDYKGTRSAEYTYSLGQKVEIGGKRTFRRQSARAEREVSVQSGKGVKLDIIRDVTIAYGDVLAAQERLALAEAREKLAQDVLANVSQRVGAARDPLIYKNQAEVALATARLERQKALRDKELAKGKLASFWKEKTLALPLQGDLLETVETPQAWDVYQERLKNNPDFTSAEGRIQARQADLKLEKAQNVPDPSVQVGIRTFRESKNQAVVLGLSMPLPVWDRNRGNIDKARADIVQAEQEGAQTYLLAEQELKAAWQDWQSAHGEAQELHRRIIPSAREALELSRAGYARGRFSFLEVLNAQRTLAEAQEQQVNAEQRALSAKAIVERLAPLASEHLIKGETK